jgi:hypothetical protein
VVLGSRDARAGAGAHADEISADAEPQPLAA